MRVADHEVTYEIEAGSLTFFVDVDIKSYWYEDTHDTPGDIETSHRITKWRCEDEDSKPVQFDVLPSAVRFEVGDLVGKEELEYD
jgi:hypothetical protein